jgi:hypothetical protein
MPKRVAAIVAKCLDHHIHNPLPDDDDLFRAIALERTASRAKAAAQFGICGVSLTVSGVALTCTGRVIVSDQQGGLDLGLGWPPVRYAPTRSSIPPVRHRRVEQAHQDVGNPRTAQAYRRYAAVALDGTK